MAGVIIISRSNVYFTFRYWHNLDIPWAVSEVLRRYFVNGVIQIAKSSECDALRKLYDSANYTQLMSYILSLFISSIDPYISIYTQTILYNNEKSTL